MNPVWTPEIEVGDDLARRLISSQFPELADARIRRFGNGWDNAAFLVDDRFIFRFPQRAIAAPLIEREIEFVPAIAQHVPVSVPNPIYAGVAQFDYPWRFAGYAIVAGSTACGLALTLEERRGLAEDLARFLRALHDIDAESFHAELPPDEIGKLDPKRLQVSEEPVTGKHVVVHGDLYARHLILDDANRLTGVIDWGDIHFGHPAVDLSIVHMMVPPRDHGRFLDAYGSVDEKTWRFARHRARHHANMVLNYSASIGDEALQASARTALRYIEG